MRFSSANHGSVCYGEDVYKAFFKMETVEHFARVTLVAELLGGPKVLPKHEVGKLFEARGRYGVQSHNRHGAWPAGRCRRRGDNRRPP